MGFLDHSTNNIILDAVLTDLGREFLARNDGSFSIVKFALSDDEVDYGQITKFGRTVGKEKIEKNTPIFEANTNQEVAQKYRLVSISNPNLVYFPNLSLTGQGVDSSGEQNIVSMGRTGAGRTRTLTISQNMASEEVIDVELRDQVFAVKMDNTLLRLDSVSPDVVDPDNLATYLIMRDNIVGQLKESQVTLRLQVRSIPTQTFNVRALAGDTDTIKTYVDVIGLQSGGHMVFEIQIAR